MSLGWSVIASVDKDCLISAINASFIINHLSKEPAVPAEEMDFHLLAILNDNLFRKYSHSRVCSVFLNKLSFNLA